VPQQNFAMEHAKVDAVGGEDGRSAKDRASGRAASGFALAPSVTGQALCIPDAVTPLSQGMI